jgi:hypothetical protein
MVGIAAVSWMPEVRVAPVRRKRIAMLVMEYMTIL